MTLSLVTNPYVIGGAIGGAIGGYTAVEISAPIGLMIHFLGKITRDSHASRDIVSISLQITSAGVLSGAFLGLGVVATYKLARSVIGSTQSEKPS